jgi:hypothetical protein
LLVFETSESSVMMIIFCPVIAPCFNLIWVTIAEPKKRMRAFQS